MGERKTLCIDRDTGGFACLATRLGNSSSLTRKHVGKIEDKTEADLLDFLRRALVSIQLQSPRRQRPPQQPPPSTKDCARHADPNDAPIQGLLGPRHQGAHCRPTIR